MKSSVCVDASFIIRTLVPGPHSDLARARLTAWQRAPITLLAPGLLSFEVSAVLRRMVYSRNLPPAAGDTPFRAFRGIRIRLISNAVLSEIAWHLAKDLNRPRTYDTSYLAVAQLYDVDFWTADEKLYNAVVGKRSYVRWVGEELKPDL